jgi:predicted Zn-dependent protease
MDYMGLKNRYLSEASSYLQSKKIRRALFVFVIIGTGVGGYYINRYVQKGRQQNAIAAFNEAMQTYVTALISELDPNGKKEEKAPWEEVELAFQTAHEQNSGAQFAPFFLIYSAQALAGQQKFAEAANMIGAALKQLPASSPFYDLCAIMQANFLIDGGDQAGVDQLRRLADSSKNYADMAQYYLAQYYLAQNQNEAAQVVFQKLALQQSAWGNLAKEYV